jgi:hypothetical protein
MNLSQWDIEPRENASVTCSVFTELFGESTRRQALALLARLVKDFGAQSVCDRIDADERDILQGLRAHHHEGSVEQVTRAFAAMRAIAREMGEKRGQKGDVSPCGNYGSRGSSQRG